MTNKIKDDPRIDKRLKAVFGDIPVDSVMDSVAQTRDEILEEQNSEAAQQGVEVSSLSLLPLLPVIFFAATIPTPMRAAAITSWIILFPENEGEMAAFGFLQHNFFILFNAVIGLMFLPRANKELFGDKSN